MRFFSDQQITPHASPAIIFFLETLPGRQFMISRGITAFTRYRCKYSPTVQIQNWTNAVDYADINKRIYSF